MKKRLYRDPGSSAAQINIFDSAVYNPVRDQDNEQDDGAYMDDDPADNLQSVRL